MALIATVTTSKREKETDAKGSSPSRKDYVTRRWGKGDPYGPPESHSSHLLQEASWLTPA